MSVGGELSPSSADGASPLASSTAAARQDTPALNGGRRRRPRRGSVVVNLAFDADECGWRSEDVLARRVARCTMEPDPKKQRRAAA